MAKTILNNKVQYGLVSQKAGIPWQCIGVIHSRESSCDFTRHLHNGDPLTDRTVHAPSGRPVAMPKSGQMPYQWVESAIDALTGLWKPLSWDLNGQLEFLERYNGLGYQKHEINSPYLWSFTNQYSQGLFVADGSFDPKVVCNQPGVAAIMKSLQQSGAIELQ